MMDEVPRSRRLSTFSAASWRPARLSWLQRCWGGRPRLVSNAHRTHDHGTFAHCFAPLDLVEFALIEGRGLRADHGAPARACGQILRLQTLLVPQAKDGAVGVPTV
jgi:hypothetical protein